MSDGIYSALSGAIASQRAVDVVANNVANANTVGFRADRLAFDEVLSQANDPSNGRPDPLRYVATARMATDEAPGSMRSTGNALDLALEGPGYFVLETPRGERYTRAGAFVADQEGTLRTVAGDPVQGENGGPIRLPAGAREIMIGRDGAILADGAAVGRVRVVEIADVTKDGLTLFSAASPVRAASTTTSVVQAHLEGSNVNAVTGVNELIGASRSFEAFQKVIQAFRALDERAARDLGSR